MPDTIAAKLSGTGQPMDWNWQYFAYFIAGAALLLFVMRARGGAGMKGYALIALAIFLVLGVLLLVNALSR